MSGQLESTPFCTLEDHYQLGEKLQRLKEWALHWIGEPQMAGRKEKRYGKLLAHG
jgi:hypothetical protein